MKQQDIDEMNVDDYIRQEKRRGRKKIYWSKKGWKVLRNFFMANAPCVHGWVCVCSEGVDDWTKKNFKSGVIFMGIKHFIK